MIGWILVLPGLPHRLEHGDDGIDVLVALQHGFGGRLEGDRLVGRGDLDAVFAAVAGEVRGLGVAAAVGPVAAWHEGMPMGLHGLRLRDAARFARVGEVLALDGVDVVDGIGRFGAPEAIVKAVGAPLSILRDYR